MPTRKEKYLRWGFYAWIIFVYISNTISNFLTGIHSVDQIFFGTCLGVWLGYFCNAVVRKPIYHHVTKLLNGEFHAQGYGRLLKYLFLIWLVNFLIITSIYFWVRSYEETYKDQFWFNKIKIYCPPKGIEHSLAFAKAEYAVAQI